MAKKAFLVSGHSQIYIETMSRLEETLTNLDCKCKSVLAGIPALLSLFVTIFKTKKDEPFLLIYFGHGNRCGWEGGLFYPLIIIPLLFVKGPLLVVSDTCYGLIMLKYLKRIRSKGNTGFISPWDSEGLSTAGCVTDIIDYWPKGTTVESEFEIHFFSSLETGDIMYPVQQRWGANFDHLFYS